MKNSKLAALAVAAVLTVSGGTVVVASATAANGQDTTCTPEAAVLSAWGSVGKLPTQHENTPPVDPDGTDEASTTNLIKFEGPVETKHVTVEAQPVGPFVDTDPLVTQTTEENLLPVATSGGERWIFLNEVNGDLVKAAVEGGHFSWTGGNRGVDNPPTTFPPTDSQNWQDNRESEPPGHLNSSTWYPLANPTPGVGLHVVGNSPSNASWFYTLLSSPAEYEKDYVWKKQVRTPAVTEVSHTDYQWEKFTRTFTPAVVCDPETPTETPTTPTETPTTPVETPVVPTETPTTPTETPEVPEETPTPEDETPVSNPPKDKQVIECVDGVFVTTVNGEVISESGSCVERDENDEPVTFSETGL